MTEILKSASKIVFLAIAVTICVTFLWEVFLGKVVLEAKDFMGLAMLVFGFYFAAKPSDPTVGSSK